ncbi:hypothetical protein D3C77_471250 [compost metagenome]
MECIVHFDIVHEQGAKELRGLIFVDDDKSPSKEDLLEMFEQMGYKLRIVDEDQLIFKPVDSGVDYSQIRVKKLDMGQKEHKDDHNLKSIVGNLLPQKPSSL